MEFWENGGESEDRSNLGGWTGLEGSLTELQLGFLVTSVSVPSDPMLAAMT